MIVIFGYFMNRLSGQEAERTEKPIDGWKRAAAIIIVLAIAGGGIAGYEIWQTGQIKIDNYGEHNGFLEQAGTSLIDLHQVDGEGWRFKSEIQAPHYQTDRDVGAASVGMG